MDTVSEEETQALGRQIAKQLPTRGTVLLIGNLGAGKTTLTKGIVAGLGLDPNEVSSPTYGLIHEYGQPPRVHHVDLYRLETAEEVEGIGLEELLSGETLVLVEWGERFPELFPPNRTEIRIDYLADDSRRVTIIKTPTNPIPSKA